MDYSLKKSFFKGKKIRFYLIYLLALLLAIFLCTGCASMKYGQVPCPCENVK